MKSLLLTCTLFLCCGALQAQYKYELGLDGGFLFQQYKLTDPASGLKKEKTYYDLPNGIGAFVLQVNTPTHWLYRASAGFYGINYNYDLKNATTYAYGNPKDNDENLYLMGSVGCAIPVGNRLKISPFAGIALNARITEGVLGQHYDDPYKTGVEFTRVHTNAIFGTANGKLELSYYTKKRILFSLSGNYMLGLSNRTIHSINYKINNSPMQYATMVGRGSFAYITAGIRYQFKKIGITQTNSKL